MVLSKCRHWAGQVGEIKVSDDGANPMVSLHVVGVDTEGVLENAKVLDNYGNRIQKVKHTLYETCNFQRWRGICSRLATTCCGVAPSEPVSCYFAT